MVAQRTIKNEVRAIGVGVHSGGEISMVLRPAPVDTGILFRRVDQDPIIEIPAKADNVCETAFCTTLCKGDIKIATVEHLLAALSGLGIDNLIVDINGAEVPIMDGSASDFVFLLRSAGFQEQSSPKKFIQITKPIRVEDGDKWVRLEPTDNTFFEIDVTIDFEHAIIKATNQNFVVDVSETTFVKEISRARTFGFLSDFEWLTANNLAKGGSLDNSVVLDNDRILNPGGLRYPDEFVRHKALDVIGDLYLLGMPVIGKLTGYKTGHALNNQLTKAILSSDSYRIVELVQTAEETIKQAIVA